MARAPVRASVRPTCRFQVAASVRPRSAQLLVTCRTSSAITVLVPAPGRGLRMRHYPLLTGHPSACHVTPQVPRCMSSPSLHCCLHVHKCCLLHNSLLHPNQFRGTKLQGNSTPLQTRNLSRYCCVEELTPSLKDVRACLQACRQCSASPRPGSAVDPHRWIAGGASQSHAAACSCPLALSGALQRPEGHHHQHAALLQGHPAAPDYPEPGGRPFPGFAGARLLPCMTTDI